MTQSETTETRLKIVRTIQAPVKHVWQAIADEERVAQWFCPGTRRCELELWDFKEGGRFKLAFVPTHDDGFGGPSPAHGVFQRIVDQQEIAMTWNWEFPDEDHNEPESRLMIALRETPEGTEVTFIHEGLPDKESVEGHYGGWMTVLPKLEALFS